MTRSRARALFQFGQVNTEYREVTSRDQLSRKVLLFARPISTLPRLRPLDLCKTLTKSSYLPDVAPRRVEPEGPSARIRLSADSEQRLKENYDGLSQTHVYCHF